MKLTSSAVVLVLLALAGCGGSDSSFADDYNKAVRPLSRLGENLGTKPAAFDRLAKGTARTRHNLARLDPPADARDEFDGLLARLDEVTRDLQAVASAERSKNVPRQRRAAKRLVQSSSAVERAETKLKRAVNG
ncbi:MAG TPA: hypothetical protein VGO83_12850 [Thermoleophilaceae bacterium]|jgi:hypothetical protein|nr:hypothetical protein [Thermoleophilaceae bacterium]